VLRGCGVDLGRLRREVLNYVDNSLATSWIGSDVWCPCPDIGDAIPLPKASEGAMLAT
jgi:hypothetical protein